MKKIVSRFVPLLILCSLLVSLPKNNMVEASGSIYIRADEPLKERIRFIVTETFTLSLTTLVLMAGRTAL